MILLALRQLCQPGSWISSKSCSTDRPHRLLVTPLQLWSVSFSELCYVIRYRAAYPKEVHQSALLSFGVDSCAERLSVVFPLVISSSTPQVAPTRDSIGGVPKGLIAMETVGAWLGHVLREKSDNFAVKCQLRTAFHLPLAMLLCLELEEQRCTCKSKVERSFSGTN